MKLTVMTLNCRYDRPDPGDQAWSVRVHSVLDRVREHQPDILLTQECLPHQLVELVVGLQDFSAVGRDRRGTGRGEYCALFYRHERFECREHGDFALSATPEEIGSVTPAWGNGLPRVATWALLHDRKAGLELFALNTHLDHDSRLSRERSAELILRRTEALISAGCSVIIGGDFNAEWHDPARQLLGDGLDDAVAKMDGDTLTYVDFEGAPLLSIDTVFYSRDFALRRALIDRATPRGIRPSDHFPIVVNLEGVR